MDHIDFSTYWIDVFTSNHRFIGRMRRDRAKTAVNEGKARMLSDRQISLALGHYPICYRKKVVKIQRV